MKRLLMAVAAAAMLVGLAGPAFAEEEHGRKCNSGRGNGSETTPDNDCDPGNSGDHNSGGD
ncbi:MAG TPA: hypothetical protein VFP06_10310 [Acidimicrobiales bacterium]|nr:hypothetical protein [Acidimicrobiales bacterium]